MKHIAITFDDGRSDNYLLAKPIMDKYHLRGTVYITTGFVDGTWEDKDVLESPTRPITVDEIVALYQSGWEIGLHGDKHKTQVEDMRNALNKLQSWGIENSYWGMSVPNSVTDEAEVARVFESEYGNRIAYIRRGRKCDTTKLSNRLLFGMYSVFKFNWAYRRFNALNFFDYNNADITNIPSIVVKANDKPEMLIDFVKHIPEGTVVVLMLHSILPAEHPLYGKEPWSWRDDCFEVFCKKIKEMIDDGIVNCAPLIDYIKG